MRTWLLLSFLLLVASAGAATLLADPITTIQPRPDGLWLVFSNTPPRWTLEQTEDLSTWHHVVTGSTTNMIVEIRIQSGMEAIFWRLRPAE